MSDNSLEMVMKRLTDLTDGTDLTDKSAYPERSRVITFYSRRPSSPLKVRGKPLFFYYFTGKTVFQMLD